MTMFIKITTALAIAAFAGDTVAQENPSRTGQSYAEEATQGAQDVIFSNLGNSPDSRFNDDPSNSFTIAGKNAPAESESWTGARFVPATDVQATVLLAAIGYESGTKRVNLGIYSDNGFGTVGNLIPGGQATTTRIPGADTCCQLAKVTLSGSGVVLTAGTPYWLVASPDNTNGADFVGAWRKSNEGNLAGLVPPFGWDTHSSAWPAAEIRGIRLQSKLKALTQPNGESDAGRVKIFSNFGPTSLGRYSTVAGSPVIGSDVSAFSEDWSALPFTPKKNSHATTLKAAIVWISGTKKVNLGIYSDNGGVPGTVLPNGQGSATDIPESGDCCKLTTVTLTGEGVALTAGVQYWLVASTDDVTAPDFYGGWRDTTFAFTAYTEPERGIGWTSFSGNWLAAEIDGTNP